MLIVMSTQATPEEIGEVAARAESLGLQAHPIHGQQRLAIAVTGMRESLNPMVFETLAGVIEVIPLTLPYTLVSREAKAEDSVVMVGSVPVGGPHFAVMAGPCAVEGREQILTIAAAVRRAGAHILRGGAYKPRTSPYSFQGLGREGLEWLHEAGRESGMPVVTEALDERSLDVVCQYADMVQVGARSMHNYPLLKACGRARLPVLLKRGMGSTVEELLLAAEYIVSEGNRAVVLCERGIRTFAEHTRFTLDLSAVVAVQRLSHLPIVVDPSHGTGKRHKVVPMARGAAAVGANGLLIEVHDDPGHALSDGQQAILPEELAELLQQLPVILPLTGKTLAPRATSATSA
ncbi:MAG TPA: 3-deoxy-7-phosphoheptulonate synthase [Thermoanaerobaculaceae bacterium]|nr:3-deoxy-7-phosphoheptulonate synthase [Thermoanaerobaculaceae bacterium]HPS77411.1 3-deoxy-7-phosphoheptulonate synthase [Thermoanaerobaculaceae bacterium]